MYTSIMDMEFENKNESNIQKSSQRERFEKLAESRVNKALDAMRIVSNLANKNNYEYSEDEAKAIYAALESEARSVRTRFEQEQRRKRNFKL